MKTVGDILPSAEQEVWGISVRDSVLEALKLMSEKNIGALIVRDGSRKVVGIVSERDYARKVTLMGKTSKETPVEAIMTPASQMISVEPDASLETCMRLMTTHHIRHLPVFAKERLVGIISSRDVVQSLIEEAKLFAENLKDISHTIFTHRFDDHLAGGKG